MPDRSDCSVVIPHLKGTRPLLACLQALHDAEVPPEVVLVDNASTDGSTERAVGSFPQVRVVEAVANLGYAGACNLGLEHASGRWTVFLNDDAVVAPGTIGRLVERMEGDSEPDRLILQPALRSASEPWRFDYAGGAGGLMDRWGYPFALGRIFDELEADEGQYLQAGPLAWASGCCMAGSAVRFRQLGGFESTFFAHFEEIDLCWRHRRDGGRIEAVPDALVYHMGPSTLPVGARKTYLNFRNNLWTIRRNLPASHRARVLAVRAVLDAAALVRAALKGRPREALAIARGWASGLLRTPWSRVVPPPAVRTDTWQEGRLRGSIVAARFLRGIRRASDLRGRLVGWERTP